MKAVKLQVFFVLITFFNLIYRLLFPFFIRNALLRITGCQIGKNSAIQGVRFFSFGKFSIGENSIVNSGCYLDNRRGISIGCNVVVAHDCKLYTLGHNYNDPHFKTQGAAISIGDYSVLFSNVMIMPGIEIGEGAVVLPGSVVTRNVPAFTVVGGNPARFIKNREQVHFDRPVYKYWFSI